MLGVQATLFDRVIAAVSEEYRREVGDRLRSPEQRQAERVKKLLAGELRDTSDLAYELEGNHLGVVAVGRAAADGLSELARTLDRRLLLVHREEETVWAWLGGKRDYDPAQIEEVAGENWPESASVAIGEPGRDAAGWRLTHRQAKAALQIALGGQANVVRYRDVALLASILQDDLLASSLRLLYLLPLATERDGGKALRETLRAYFATGGNISSTAAALGVSRQTVRSRLRTIEVHFGDSLERRSVEVDVALRMHDFQECAGSPPIDLAEVG